MSKCHIVGNHMSRLIMYFNAIQENKNLVKISKFTVQMQNEPVSGIRYKLAFAFSEDSNQSEHLHSLISLKFPPEESLNPWLPIERPSMTARMGRLI